MEFRKMDQRKTSTVPSELSLTAILSSGLTLVLTVTYTVLCILALVYRFQCATGLASGASGSSFFMDTVYRVYIQADSCENPDSVSPAGVTLVNADTVFIFVLVILILSVCSCAAAIVLILVVVDAKKSRYIFATAWVHISISFSAAVVDIALATFFGLDSAKLSDLMDNSLPGIQINYRHEVLRMGSQLLMAVALKGYLAHAVHAVLLVLLAVYAARFKNRLQTEEHSIHKRGAINAYELQKREDVWQNQQESDLPFNRGQRLNVNAGFEPDAPRRSPRGAARASPVSPLSDYSNRDYDRSDSWQHSQGSRPFSYMEEPRRARAAPAAAEPWRREPWAPAPPVPAPDYSPPSRRLKSALKPNYM